MDKCLVCDTEGPSVTEMTDGRDHYPVCDDCRDLVKVFFGVYLSIKTAVIEAAYTQRGVHLEL